MSNDQNNQSIHWTCYDIGSMLKNSILFTKMICDPKVLKNQEKVSFLNVWKNKKKFFVKIEDISKNKYFCDIFVKSNI